MSKTDNLTDFLTDVADAIREKKGTTEKINPQDFSEEIRGIQSGEGGNATIEYTDKTIFGPKSYKSVEIKEGVKEIDRYALYYATNIESITVPSSITSWGTDSFAYSRVKRLELKDGLQTLGLRMCYYCTSLEEINIPEGIEEVPERAFAVCNAVKKTTLPSTLKKIHIYAFYGVGNDVYVPVYTWLKLSGHTDANFEEGITKFYATDTDEVIFNDDYQVVRDRALRYFVNIKKVILSDNINSIGNNSFDTCTELNTINLSSIKTVGDRAFIYCSSLTDVDTSSIEEYGVAVFAFCKKISSPIRINTKVTVITNNLFNNCVDIPYYDFRNSTFIPTLANSNAFSGTLSTSKIVVPDALYDDWIAATNWSSLASRIVKASEFVEPANE